MSIHIGAEKGQVAKTVLLPGDPLRAKFIAENFLEDAVCYSETRGMLGFTGKYHGKEVSVQGTGIGCPSISLYASELINFYGAENLIRVGTAGASSETLKLGQVCLAQAACSDSAINTQRFGVVHYSPVASFELLYKAYTKAQELKIPVFVGSVMTSDLFYDHLAEQKYPLLAKYGVGYCDMETNELYTLAALHHVNALAIMTISDLMYPPFSASTTEQRQTAFTDMMRLALELA